MPAFFHTYLHITMVFSLISTFSLSGTILVMNILGENNKITNSLFIITNWLLIITLICFIPIGLIIGVILLVLIAFTFLIFYSITKIKKFLRSKFVNPDY